MGKIRLIKKTTRELRNAPLKQQHEKTKTTEQIGKKEILKYFQYISSERRERCDYGTKTKYENRTITHIHHLELNTQKLK